MGPIVVAVGSAGLSERMVETVVRLAGTGDRQEAAVTVVHVARVWGTALGLQHPALQPSAGERRTAQDVIMRAALQLRAHGIEVEAVVTSGRDTGKALAATAHGAGASAVVGRSSAGRLSRLLRGPDTARTLLDRVSCTLMAVRA